MCDGSRPTGRERETRQLHSTHHILPHHVAFQIDAVADLYAAQVRVLLCIRDDLHIEPIGFELAEFHGLGGPVRQAFNRRIKEVQERFGAAAGIPLFLLSLAFLWIDRALGNRMPFSIYVKAVKPAQDLCA